MKAKTEVNGSGEYFINGIEMDSLLSRFYFVFHCRPLLNEATYQFASRVGMESFIKITYPTPATLHRFNKCKTSRKISQSGNLIQILIAVLDVPTGC